MNEFEVSSYPIPRSPHTSISQHHQKPIANHTHKAMLSTRIPSSGYNINILFPFIALSTSFLFPFSSKSKPHPLIANNTSLRKKKKTENPVGIINNPTSTPLFSLYNRTNIPNPRADSHPKTPLPLLSTAPEFGGAAVLALAGLLVVAVALVLSSSELVLVLVSIAVEEVVVPLRVLVVKEEVSVTIPVGMASDDVMGEIPELAEPAREVAWLDATAILELAAPAKEVAWLDVAARPDVAESMAEFGFEERVARAEEAELAAAEAREAGVIGIGTMGVGVSSEAWDVREEAWAPAEEPMAEAWPPAEEAMLLA